MGAKTHMHVAAYELRGRMFDITRTTWRDTDGLSYDVHDRATGQCLTAESFDDMPTVAVVSDLLNDLAADLANDSLDHFFDGSHADLRAACNGFRHEDTATDSGVNACNRFRHDT